MYNTYYIRNGNKALELYRSLINHKTFLSWCKENSTRTLIDKGKYFEYMCYYVLKYCNKYNFKKIYMYKDIPLEIKDKLNLPVQDKGIDILGENSNGTYCGIQCKFVSNISKSTSWGNLGTWAGLVAMKNMSGLLMTNSMIMCDILEKNHDKYDYCLGNFWEKYINPEFIKFLKNKLKKKIYHKPNIINISTEKKYIEVIEWLKNNKRMPDPYNHIDELKYKMILYEFTKQMLRNELDYDKIIKLESFPYFRWVTKCSEHKYKKNYKKLQYYVSENKDINENDIMVNFCKKMRLLYQKKELLPYQIEELNNIPGWYWTTEELNEQIFIENCSKVNLSLHRLLELIFGNENDRNLWLWLQRVLNEISDGTLSSERMLYIKKNVPKLDWEMLDKHRDQVNYCKTIRKIVDFIKEKERIPHVYKDDNNKSEYYLGLWCKKQKKLFDNKLLDKQYIKFLDKISFQWKKIDKRDKINLKKLKKWIKKNKKIPELTEDIKEIKMMKKYRIIKNLVKGSLISTNNINLI